MAADTNRHDAWMITYQVEVIFDTNHTRTRYDHVGTRARCTHCGQHLDLRRSPTALARHARTHERVLTINNAAGHTVPSGHRPKSVEEA